MKNLSFPILVLVIAIGCNPITIEYPLIYTDEEPNHEFALLLEEVLEDSYNVDIQLKQVNHIGEVIEALETREFDMGLLENISNEGDDIHTVVPIFPKILHVFYRETMTVESIEDLFYDTKVYVGREGSASYEFIMSLFAFYELDVSRIYVTPEMMEADVMAIFTVLMEPEMLAQFEGFKLYSFDDGDNISAGSEVEGISLKLPRVRPFIIPQRTYGDLTSEPIVTICTDMVFVVREGMYSLAVSDLIRSLFAHREKFVHVNTSFYYGIVEDFDRSKLSYSLHEGARAYLDRDEPNIFERYAELAGVIFTIALATGSGLISLRRKRSRKKKDKIDVFYAHLMDIKNAIPDIKTIEDARSKINEVKVEQKRAFEMLIDEELSANESFRIYMELSKETIEEIRIRYRLIKGSK